MCNDLTPQPGDRIAFHRADGTYDVIKIDDAGNRVTVRSGLTWELARDITWGHLENRGRALYMHHERPDKFESLR